ncbi:MAG: hypothetical protein QNK36_01915 [Colwellia sp.]|nr:hypothetical protein [Colwellia sp.]
MDLSKYSPTDFIFRELIVSIILGGVPCFLISITLGMDAVLSFFRGLNPPPIIIIYFLSLIFVHLLISGFNKNTYSPNHSFSLLKYKLHEISDQVGFSLMGLYRAFSGAVFIVLPPILYVEPTNRNIVLFVSGYFLASCSIWLLSWFSSVQIKTSVQTK